MYGQGSTFTVAIPLGSAHLPPERIAVEGAHRPFAIAADPFVEEALRWLPGHEGANAPIPLMTPHQQLGRDYVISAEIATTKERARILMADDNGDMREYLRTVHYAVATVTDGAAALDAIRREAPDLLLADVMMPRLDGLKLLQAIRSDSKLATLPVILLSAPVKNLVWKA